MSDKTFYDPRIHDQLDSRYFMTTSQSIRLQLVIELIRARRIDDFLSLAHEAEQFVLNGMENKPVDSPAESKSSWPQTQEEIVSGSSIQAGFNEKWEVKAPPKCMMPGSTIEPLPLADMCETIIKYNGKDEVAAGEWVLVWLTAGMFRLCKSVDRVANEGFTIDSTHRCESTIGKDDEIREILTQFPPFNKSIIIAPSQEDVHGGGEVLRIRTDGEFERLWKEITGEDYPGLGENHQINERMTLWDMCYAISKTTSSKLIGGHARHDMALVRRDDSSFQIYRNATFWMTIYPSSTEDGNEVRETLMGFPPFKK